VILKDIYCLKCGYEKEAYLDAYDAPPEPQSCLKCASVQKWGISGIGGTGSRYRFMDWDRDSIRGYVQYNGTEATSAAEKYGQGGQVPVKNLKTGKVLHDADRFSPEAIDDRRKRLKHRDDKRLGLGKIYVGAGRSN